MEILFQAREEPLLDSRGRSGRESPFGPVYFIFMQFSGKIWPIIDPPPVWKILDPPLRAEHLPEYTRLYCPKRVFIGRVDPEIGNGSGVDPGFIKGGANPQGGGAKQPYNYGLSVIFYVEGLKNREMITVFFRGHSFTKHALALLLRNSVFSKNVLNKNFTWKFFCF